MKQLLFKMLTISLTALQFGLQAPMVAWDGTTTNSTAKKPLINTVKPVEALTAPASEIATTPISRFLEDTDGDGVLDYVDLDDDNDGILDVTECNAVEKVTNGFNTPPPTNPLIPGWTENPVLPFGWVMSSGYAVEASKDLAGVYKISQTITGLVIGRTYTLTFRTFSAGTGNTNTLTVTIGGGSPLYSKDAGGTIGATLQNESITFTPTVTNPVLEFTSTVVGTGLAGRDIYVRDVSIMTCDLNTDGADKPDYLDLDSDNDGCPDALEGSENVTKSQLNPDGSINIAATGGVNANGVPNLVNTGGAADNGNNNVGQGIGNAINASLKDPSCYTLVLTADNYTGITGTALITSNIIANDLLDGATPVIGAAAGQVVISQSGAWPTGITLNTTTGAVTVANTVNGGVYTVSYQVCINGTSPNSCQTQTVTLTLCGKFPLAGPATIFTQTGISSLAGFTGPWPGNVPNGFVAIESTNKGFVITRVKTVSDIPVANLVEGMLVYDIAAACVKLYNGSVWKCLTKNCN